MELIFWPGIPEHECANELAVWNLENKPPGGVIVRCDCGKFYKRTRGMWVETDPELGGY